MDKLKRTIFYILTMIVANILFVRFYFEQDIYRMIAFLALLALVYLLPKISGSLAQLFHDKDISDDKSLSRPSTRIKSTRLKSIFISTCALILLIVFHSWGYYRYFQSERNDLSNKGIYTGAVVTDKRLEKRAKLLEGYYIYYSYKYNGKVYQHSCPNNTIEAGDTIIVKFSPQNPDHHIIIDNGTLN